MARTAPEDWVARPDGTWAQREYRAETPGVLTKAFSSQREGLRHEAAQPVVAAAQHPLSPEQDVARTLGVPQAPRPDVAAALAYPPRGAGASNPSDAHQGGDTHYAS